MTAHTCLLPIHSLKFLTPHTHKQMLTCRDPQLMWLCVCKTCVRFGSQNSTTSFLSNYYSHLSTYLSTHYPKPPSKPKPKFVYSVCVGPRKVVLSLPICALWILPFPNSYYFFLVVYRKFLVTGKTIKLLPFISVAKPMNQTDNQQKSELSLLTNPHSNQFFQLERLNKS